MAQDQNSKPLKILTGKWVFDTHLIVYALDGNSPFYSQTCRLFALIMQGQIQGILTQQNILEAEKVLISVYNQKPQTVIKLISDIISNFQFKVISPLPSTINRLHSLLKKAGKHFDIFDYYLASTMLDNGINKIITLNTKDFKLIKGIVPLNPFDK